MQKRHKQKKAFRKIKRKSDDLFDERNLSQPIIKPQIEENSILLQFAHHPNFVGALDWMMKGCFACGGLITILFAFRDLGRLFEKLTYQIASFIPQKFIPPDTYIPGVFFIPVCLLIISGFTVYGYKKGGIPAEIKTEKDTRSLSEKLIELLLLIAIVLAVGYFRTVENHPKFDFVQIISDPVFVIFIIIVFLGISFYVFSRNQSQQFLLFVLYSALPIGFVIFLLGLIAHTIINAFLYALIH